MNNRFVIKFGRWRALDLVIPEVITRSPNGLLKKSVATAPCASFIGSEAI